MLQADLNFYQGGRRALFGLATLRSKPVCQPFYWDLPGLEDLWHCRSAVFTGRFIFQYSNSEGILFPVFFAVALVTAAALAIQVGLTRVFSVTLWHHFTYLVIGIALLGYGVAGAVLSYWTRSGTDENALGRKRLSRRVRWVALASFAAFACSTTVRFDALELFRDPSVGVGLALLILLTAIPFFGAGLVVATALASYPKRTGSIYAADLLGAGCGAAIALPALSWLGAPGLIFVSTVVMAVAGVLFALPLGRSEIVKGVFIVVLLSTFAGLLHDDEPWAFPAPSKEIHLFPSRGPGVRKSVHRKWTPTGRIDVSAETSLPPLMGGEFGRDALAFRKIRLVMQDGAAPTFLFRMKGDLSELSFLRHSSTAAVWVARGVNLGDDQIPRGNIGAKSLVIGVGGGIDLAIALAHGADHVTGVDVNPEILALTQKHFVDYTGKLALRKDIRLVVGEGRSFIRRTDQRYDVIQLSGVDTYAALSQGAYSVAEGFLYTVEALEDYLAHLRPGGCVSFSRWIMNPPRETLRLATTAAEALRRRGVKDPATHLVVIRGNAWATLLACDKPFEKRQVQRLHAFAHYEGYRWVFNPLNNTGGAFDRALRTPEQSRKAFIADYVYQLNPTTDDAPFFFNYFRWKNLAQMGEMKSENVYTSPVPIGHGLLLGTLLLTGILAFFGIWLPARKHVGLSSRWAYTLYFGALGLAYLFVEMTFLQRLTFFLGHPSYALTVVLSALLISSGLGSAASKWVKGEKRLRWLSFGLPLVLLGAIFISRLLLVELVGLAFAGRVVVSIAVLLPVGFLMGMPFPLGLARLESKGSGLIPWAFGVNAFFTVIASSLATVIAMESAFTVLLGLAGGLYFAALMILRYRFAED